MKVKLKNLNPNPFKKEINKGKMNKKIVEKIKSNIKELGLMGSLPIFKKDDKYFLVAGHHRVQALKEAFGNNFEVEVTIHNYSNENVLRGMVVENLTQRVDELLEVGENLNAIRKFLINNKKLLDDKGNITTQTTVVRVVRSQGGGSQIEYGSSEQIHRWLSKDGNEVMSLTKIKQYLKIYDNLDKGLLAKAKSNLDKSEKDVVNVREAIVLSRLDKKEQPIMKEILDKADVSSDTKMKLVTEYKNAPEDLKEKVISQELEIKDLPLEKFKREIKERAEEELKGKEGQMKVTHFKKFQRDAGNYIGETNEKILRTCAFFDTLQKQGVLQELDWNTMYKIIEVGQVGGKRYTKFMENLMGGL